MKRSDEIKEAAIKNLPIKEWPIKEYEAFILGAEWADEHPDDGVINEFSLAIEKTLKLEAELQKAKDVIQTLEEK